MNKYNDGGPAFPGGVAGEEYGDAAGNPMQDGMTLRDWFAGQAVSHLDSGDYGEFSEMAYDAYALADAMLARREKPKP